MRTPISTVSGPYNENSASNGDDKPAICQRLNFLCKPVLTHSSGWQTKINGMQISVDAVPVVANL